LTQLIGSDHKYTGSTPPPTPRAWDVHSQNFLQKCFSHSIICVQWVNDHFGLVRRKLINFLRKICAKNDFYIFVPSNLAPLVTLVQRYISTGLEVSMAFLFLYFKKIGGMGWMDRQTVRWTDGEGAISDVTISKCRFSIDFDSIFSPKSRFRFDSSYVHAKSFPTKFRHNRRRAVVFKVTYCLYKTGWHLLIYVNSRGMYQQTTQSPWPVTNPPRISHLQTSKWQVTTMFPRSNLSQTTHQQHSRNLMRGTDGSCYCWLIPLSIYIYKIRNGERAALHLATFIIKYRPINSFLWFQNFQSASLNFDGIFNERF